MGKPRKRPDRAAPAPLAAASPSETTLFEPDDETTNSGKNAALAELLAAPWRPLAIVRVERIEGASPGWRVVFRE